jgi:hypothetical protein
MEVTAGPVFKEGTKIENDKTNYSEPSEVAQKYTCSSQNADTG